MWGNVAAPALPLGVTHTRASNNLGISPRFLTSRLYAMARFHPLPKGSGVEYDETEHGLFHEQAQLHPYAKTFPYCPCTRTALYSTCPAIDFSIYHKF
jgi:hypothetical protein